MPDQNFFDAQALRMLRAFFKVRDQDARELLIHLAESAERGCVIGGTVEGSAIRSGRADGKVVDLPSVRNPFK
jgi:hypothetical protein